MENKLNTDVEQPVISTPFGAMIIKQDDMTDESALEALKLQVRALERRDNVTGEFDWDKVEKFEKDGFNFLRILGVVKTLGEPDDGFQGTVSRGKA